MPTLPVLALLLGSLGIWLARRRREQTWWLVAIFAALATWLITLGLVGAIPAETRLSVWRPAELFASRLELILDPIGWQFVYVAATALVSILLTGVARPGEATAVGRAMMLGYTALAMMAMLSGNLLTVATSWAMMDAIRFVFLLGVVGREKTTRVLVAKLAVDSVSVALVVGAALADWARGGDVSLATPAASPWGVALLVLAAFLRLGLLPPHFGLPPLPYVRRGLGTLFRLLGPAAALCTLSRVFAAGVPTEIVPWLTGAGALSAAAGGLRWLVEADVVEGRRYFVLGVCGLGILATGLAQERAGAVLAAAGSLLVLVGTTVSVAEIHTPTHRIWPVAAAAGLAGLPWMPGAVLGQVLAGAAVEGSWLVLLVGALGLVTLCLGVMRTGLSEQTAWPTGESLVRLVYGSGLALPALAALGLGMWTSGSAGLGTWAVFLGVSGLAVALQLGLRRIPASTIARWRRVEPFLDPTPLYRLLWRGFRGLTRAVRALGDLLEGDGAMLWTYVVLILVWLAIR